MLYIEMMDTLIDTMEKDQEYKYFHLDGQTIMLEDYLQVRPENRARLQKLIGDGRIAIGPWYVLQDEFLTSSESNVRNLQMGYKLAQEFGGKWTKTGYFPDSFGNVGQAPQLLKKAGIDTAVFGRGSQQTVLRCLASYLQTGTTTAQKCRWKKKSQKCTGIKNLQMLCVMPVRTSFYS